MHCVGYLKEFAMALWFLEFALCWLIAGFVVIHAETYADRFADWFDAKYAEVRQRSEPPRR